MSAEFPVSPDARHIDAFLRKIARHRDDELQRINAQVAEEYERIRRRAYAEARALVRRVVADTRERERRRRDRHLYKQRSELTRDRWRILQDIRGRVSEEMQRRFDDAWRDSDRQWRWCRFWVEAAKTMATPAELRIHCGAGTADTVLQRLRQLLSDYPGQVNLQTDAAAPPGVLVEWQDHVLDGTLAQHCEAAVETVLRQAARILDGRSPDAVEQP